MDARRLKVLFITNWYPSRAEPLKAIWAREHAKSVLLHDDVVVLHCVGPEAKLNELWRVEVENDDELLEGVPTWRMRYRHSPIPKATYFVYLWSIFQVFKHIVREGFRPDIIHVHVYDAGAPASWWLNTFPPFPDGCSVPLISPKRGWRSDGRIGSFRSVMPYKMRLSGMDCARALKLYRILPTPVCSSLRQRCEVTLTLSGLCS